MKIELGKCYKDYWGRKVRIICTDRDDKEYPVVGLVKCKSFGEMIERYTASGATMPHQPLVAEWEDEEGA